MRLEGIKINLNQARLRSWGSYQTYTQNIGWEVETAIDWKSNGDTSGTEGQAMCLEAVQIMLVSESVIGLINLKMPGLSPAI